MTTRLATLNDVNSINDLLSDFFEYNANQQPQNYISTKESGEYSSSVIISETGDFIVSVVDNNIVGLLHIEETSTPPYPSVAPHRYACIVDFIVNEKFRNKGIGNQLLNTAKTWAKSRNLGYIELMVLENNELARKFYEHEDFYTTSRTMRFDNL